MNSPNKFMMTLQVRYVSITNNMTTGSNIRNMGQKQNSHGKTICALSKLRVDQAHMQMIVKYTIPRVNGSTKICTSTNSHVDQSQSLGIRSLGLCVGLS